MTSCPSFVSVFWTLTWVRGGRSILGRELQHRDELLQSDLEHLRNFQKRMAVGNALQDLSQRRVSSTNHPNLAGFSLDALRCRTF
jgi:hypothetical protein